MRNVISVFHVCVQICKARNFRFHDQRLYLAIESVVAASTRAVEVSFAEPLNLDFADEFAHPLAGLRFFGREPYASRGLREHDLGEMTVQVLKLCLPLKSENNWIIALASLCNGCVKLREFL